MTKPRAWLIDTSVLTEMMKPRPEPRVATFLDVSSLRIRVRAHSSEAVVA